MPDLESVRKYVQKTSQITLKQHQGLILLTPITINSLKVLSPDFPTLRFACQIHLGTLFRKDFVFPSKSNSPFNKWRGT